ncbi:glycoside hydrolase family 61 protein [Colletotrichum kahawae]|uniref:lytic cellulose monooxygenase (C4-dehydrogenating) n=1 Tax=Colletotrichum kahawae TaxID=34407 RepID=A0AAE0D5X0_COLKA|nr:glycoside hydrolase family 61 protein [Colletotrichum kahawae]
MRFSYTAAALAALTGQAAAHARVYALWSDGAEIQVDGKSGYESFIRSPPNNNPVKDITSKEIVCNADPSAKTGFAPIEAGKSVVFEWYHNTRGDDIIDGSHKGPLSTYIAEYTEGDGTGAIWTKISEEKYANGKWPVDTLIANKGKSGEVTIPASLKPGKYLLRHEIIALHESDTTYAPNSARGAQFYPSCVQIEVSGSGSDVPPENFDFQTGYKYTDSGIHFNLYNDDASSYKAPGPEVWTGGAGSGSGSTPATSAAPAATSKAAATSAAAAPTTLATQVSSAAPVATSAPAATSAAAATPSKAPSTGCKRRRAARKARRSAH